MPPERFSNGRITRRDRPQGRVRYFQDCSLAKRMKRNCVAGDDHGVKVRRISGNVEGGDLPLPLRVLPETRNHTVRNHGDMIDRFVQMHKISLGLNIHNVGRKIEKRFLLGLV